jgi:hypothetical protein
MTRPINIATPTIKTNRITSDVDAAAVESIVAAAMKVTIQASQIESRERGSFMTQVLPEFAPPICHPIKICAYPPTGVCPKLLTLPNTYWRNIAVSHKGG